MARMEYDKVARRERVRKYGSLNDNPSYKRNTQKSKKPVQKRTTTQDSSSLWTEWVFLEHKNHWTRTLKLTENVQPWE